LDLYKNIITSLNSHLGYEEIINGLPIKQVILTLKENVFLILVIIIKNLVICINKINNVRKKNNNLFANCKYCDNVYFSTLLTFSWTFSF